MSLLGYIVVLFLDKLEDLCCGPSQSRFVKFRQLESFKLRSGSMFVSAYEVGFILPFW